MKCGASETILTVDHNLQPVCVDEPACEERCKQDLEPVDSPEKILPVCVLCKTRNHKLFSETTPEEVNANIATTQIYTHITDKQLRDVHKRFHSKGK
jgi:hypothetical protein